MATKPNDNKMQAAPAGTTGANAPATGPGDDEMSEWRGEFGGNVDGWWSPPPEATATVTGILVNFIDKARSEKLQSNSVVFELLEGADHVKNGGSDRVPGSKGDGKLHKVTKGTMVAVPEWKQLVGLWPAKAGHKVVVTRGPRRDIGKGRKMYDVKLFVSNKPVRHIEISEVDNVSDAATGGMNADPSFQVEAEA
jgi:hypothetical protein